jgi:hypothetical protein
MGGLLKSWIIKWVRKQASGKRGMKEKSSHEAHRVLSAFACFAARRFIQFSPTDSQHLHPREKQYGKPPTK